MMQNKQPRGQIRLRLDRGTALLKQIGVASVMCTLLDFSETGCACRISLEGVHAEDAMEWRNAVTSGRLLTLEITEPPELSHLQFSDAEVRWVKPSGLQEIEFGVLLKNIDPVKASLLNQAMLVVATEKLRKNSGRMSAISPNSEESSPPPSPPAASAEDAENV